MLVGMQRERANSQAAGLRTFAFITVLGTICGLLSLSLGGWIIAAGLLSVAAAMVIANVAKIHADAADPGMTTEIASFVMFATGAYIVLGHREVAAVVGGAVAVLLHAKPILHGFVRRMGESEVRAIMQLALITLVILPLLPDRPYGPFDVLNPREIWCMVVLVTGISFGGYIAYRLFGQHAGTVLSGILGGVISSTATTVSYSRRASTAQGHVAAATVVIMLASTVVYARVLFETAVVAGTALPEIAPPIVIMLGAGVLLSLAAWCIARKGNMKLPPQEHPTELKSAMVFGALYAVVIFAVAAAEHYFSQKGIYIVAAISGLTDMDAITLSTSRMVVNEGLDASTAWRAIIIASIANMLFKAGIVASAGGGRLLASVAVLFGLHIALGVGLLVLWPG